MYHVQMNNILYADDQTVPCGRYLGVGTVAETHVTGLLTTHRIVERLWVGGGSQSGILFRLDPPVVTEDESNAWVDADWFSPVVTTRHELEPL